MNYTYKPIYKYLSILILIILFIVHQKTNLQLNNIIIIAYIFTIIMMINDFIFIKNHLNIFFYKKKIQKPIEDDDDYVDELIDTIMNE